MVVEEYTNKITDRIKNEEAKIQAVKDKLHRNYLRGLEKLGELSQCVKCQEKHPMNQMKVTECNHAHCAPCYEKIMYIVVNDPYQVKYKCSSCAKVGKIKISLGDDRVGGFNCIENYIPSSPSYTPTSPSYKHDDNSYDTDGGSFSDDDDIVFG